MFDYIICALLGMLYLFWLISPKTTIPEQRLIYHPDKKCSDCFRSHCMWYSKDISRMVCAFGCTEAISLYDFDNQLGLIKPEGDVSYEMDKVQYEKLKEDYSKQKYAEFLCGRVL